MYFCRLVFLSTEMGIHFNNYKESIYDEENVDGVEEPSRLLSFKYTTWGYHCVSECVSERKKSFVLERQLINLWTLEIVFFICCSRERERERERRARQQQHSTEQNSTGRSDFGGDGGRAAPLF